MPTRDSGIVADCERSFLGDGKSDGWLARFSAYSYRVPFSSILPSPSISSDLHRSIGEYE